MRKKNFRFFFAFTIIFFIAIIFPNFSYADDIKLNLGDVIGGQHQTIELGQTIKIAILNLPQVVSGTNNEYYLDLNRLSGGTSDRDKNLETTLMIVTRKDGTCTTVPFSSGRTTNAANAGWGNPSCNFDASSSLFTFAADFNTGKLTIDRNSTIDISYLVVLRTKDYKQQFASDSFTIKAPNETKASFSIESITPNPASPGQTLTITLKNINKDGTYKYGLQGQKPDTKSCSIPKCTLSYNLQATITNPSIVLIIEDPDGNKISTTISIDLKTATPTPTIPPFPPPCLTGDMGADGKCKQITTGLGISIPVDPVGFVKSLFGILLSLSGGIALVLIIMSGYQLMTSQGNPEKVQAAKETLTSAIVGLLFIIFSMVILQIIGVKILEMPWFQ